MRFILLCFHAVKPVHVTYFISQGRWTTSSLFEFLRHHEVALESIVLLVLLMQSWCFLDFQVRGIVAVRYVLVCKLI